MDALTLKKSRFRKPPYKGYVRYTFVSWYLKKSTCENMKNLLYFTSKALFVLDKIKF